MGRHLQCRVAGPGALRDAFEAHHPAELRRHRRLHQRVVSVRPVLAKPGHGAVDEVRPLGGEGLVAQTQLLPARLGQRRDHGVRGLQDGGAQGVEFGRIVEVHRQQGLAPLPHARRRHGAMQVAGGGFHFDDLGAEVRKDHRGQPRDGALAQVEDAEGGEGLAHGWGRRQSVAAAMIRLARQPLFDPDAPLRS